MTLDDGHTKASTHSTTYTHTAGTTHDSDNAVLNDWDYIAMMKAKWRHLVWTLTLSSYVTNIQPIFVPFLSYIINILLQHS